MRRVKEARVISASRRVDMVGSQPRKLVEILNTKHPPSEVHTLVIWTKNPVALTQTNKLRKTVFSYTQVFVHCTITGMGGTILEPGIPPMEEALHSLKELIALTGSPERVRLRFDPIVHFVLPDGRMYSNLHHFRRVASIVGGLGIPAIIVSWAELYQKVLARLTKEGIEAIVPSEKDLSHEREYLMQECAANGLKLLGCCAEGLESASCIDGRLFTRLHPLGLECSVAKARGQRPQCTCTDSTDIGWYAACSHGCIYCYANPGVNESYKDAALPR